MLDLSLTLISPTDLSTVLQEVRGEVFLGWTHNFFYDSNSNQCSTTLSLSVFLHSYFFILYHPHHTVDRSHGLHQYKSSCIINKTHMAVLSNKSCVKDLKQSFCARWYFILLELRWHHKVEFGRPTWLEGSVFIYYSTVGIFDWWLERRGEMSKIEIVERGRGDHEEYSELKQCLLSL